MTKAEMETALVTSAQADANTVSTHGWDTVFAIPAKDVNQAIIDQKSSPPSFDYSDSSSRLNADFGDWQITQGGDGKNIRLAIPLKNLQLHYLSTGKVVTVKSATAVAEIELEYLPHTPAVAAAGSDDADTGTLMALKPKLTSDEPTAPVFDVVTVIYPDDETIGLVSKAVIQATFQEWGNANLRVFDHVFSVVDLNRRVDQGEWAFVTPHETSYAYLDIGDSVDTSLFGVLTMTGDRSGDTNNAQIAYDAIPSGSVAGFLISQARTLNDLIRPAIMQAYPGLTDENFQLNASQDALFLTNGAVVDLAPVHHHGSTYHPKLTRMKVSALGTLLTMTSHTETKIVDGITAECEATHWYVLELGQSKNGQTIKFRQFQPPVIKHTINQSKGSQITQLIIAIVASVALLILAVLTDGTALIVGGLVIGLLLGADKIVPALIEKANEDDSPALDLLRINAVDPIRWPNSGQFSLDYASLNMSLQLGGNPNFV
ncbi:MAG: hypothetical protein Tsb002_15680 [Wenzhouxiangellaceae bacterium]